MKNILLFKSLLLLIIFVSCEGQSQQKKNVLNPKEFQEALTKIEDNAVIVDVRTADEFSNGKIKNALNIDFLGDDFIAQFESKIKKDQPIYIYCFSGKRSHNAAISLREKGYNNITEMSGGLIKWEAEGLPLEHGETKVEIMQISLSDYQTMINDTIPVLVDFYAPWCAPCKKIGPQLDKYFAENAGKYKLIKINADEQKNICKEMQITAIPVFIIYKNNKETWKKEGETTIEEINEKLK